MSNLKAFLKKKWAKPMLVALGLLIAIMSVPIPDEETNTPNTEISSEVGDNQTTEDQLAQKPEESEKESEGKNEIESEKESESESEEKTESHPTYLPTTPSITASKIPAYTGKAYVALNNNVPNFPTENLAPISYEYYSELDSLGRCGVVFACVGQDIMPTEEREGIGQVKPTGWHTVKYDIVDGKYLYNRCHLIGFQLTGGGRGTVHPPPPAGR